jgi:flagellar basal body rod protein FlgG
MDNTLLVGLSRQVALARELDVVANNIANMNTAGFKADGSIFEEFLSPTAQASSPIMADRKVSFVQDRGTWHDLSAGAFERTGNPLDVAIDGKGFLVVNTPRGERYTRNGSLQIGPTGTLVTSDGFEVAGESGPITLQRTDRNISISAEGTVSVREGSSIQDTPRGKRRIVRRTPRFGRAARDGLQVRPTHDREIECARGRRDHSHDRAQPQLHPGRGHPAATKRNAHQRNQQARRCSGLSEEIKSCARFTPQLPE